MKNQKIFVFFLLLTVNFIISPQKTKCNSQEKLHYGDPSPVLSGEDILSNQITHLEKGYWTLIQYFGPSIKNSINIVKYLEIIKNKFRNLKIISIADENPLSLIARDAISYPIILDKKSVIKNKLRISDLSSATFIIDPNLIIKFAYYDTTSTEDIRQLIERFLNQEISFLDKNEDVKAKVREKFSYILLKKVGKENILNLSDEMMNLGLLIIWSASCTHCILEQYKDQVSSLEQRAGKDKKYFHIFSSKFWEREIIEYLGIDMIKEDKYFIAMQEIPGIENLYYSESYFDFSIVAVHLDSEGFIIKIESFLDFLNEYGMK